MADQKSGIFWDISYSGTGPLQVGSYLLGEPWFRIDAGQSATITQIGRFFPGTTNVDPSYTGPRILASGQYRDGTMKNPRGGGALAVVGGNDQLTRRPTGYDSRGPNSSFPSLFASSAFEVLPLSVSPGDALVSTVSQPESTAPSCGSSYPWAIPAFPGECTSSPTRLAAVLTCVSVAPTASVTFRPPYSMPTPQSRDALPPLTTSSIDWSQLPRVAPLVNPTNPPPTPGYLAGFMNRVWLEHVSGESVTYLLFPNDHMHGYGVWQRRVISSAALLAMINPDPGQPNLPSASPPLSADFRQMIFGMLQIARGIGTSSSVPDRPGPPRRWSPLPATASTHPSAPSDQVPSAPPEPRLRYSYKPHPS